MDDSISRQAAIDALDDVLVEDDSCKVWFKLALKQLPSAERRGRWMIQYGEHEAFGIRPFYRFCSECNEVTVFPYRYCPNCGAKMDGE